MHIRDVKKTSSFFLASEAIKNGNLASRVTTGEWMLQSLEPSIVYSYLVIHKPWVETRTGMTSYFSARTSIEKFMIAGHISWSNKRIMISMTPPKIRMRWSNLKTANSSTPVYSAMMTTSRNSSKNYIEKKVKIKVKRQNKLLISVAHPQREARERRSIYRLS